MALTDPSPFGRRFEEAFALANQLHQGHVRKASEIPYISHLMSVTALVLQDGGDEDEAIAALLHDAVEDQGGEQTLALIRERFGSTVAEIVYECSDAFTTPKPPWQERKEEHLERLKEASPSAHRVMLADKLHNARAILREFREKGEKAWKLSKGGKEGMLWYFHTIHELLGETNRGYLWQEFGRVIEEIERLSGVD
ncbi:MAG: HD domain-containing protein [Anaerolineales bacterium]|jgi:(p)ppGpp synthase/HD superfamily hydrolase